MNKPFDSELYEKHDHRAKEFLINHIGSNSSVNPDRYGPDVIEGSLLNIYHEVEVKVVWTDSWPFAWETVDIPARKKKFLSYRPIFFWVFERDLKFAWKVPGFWLRESGVESKRCDLGSYYFDDKFFRINKKLCYFYEFNEATPETYNP